MKSVITELVRKIARERTDKTRIAFLGFGKTNRAIFDILTESSADCIYSVYTDKEELHEPWMSALPCLEFKAGGDALASIDSDIAFVSPSFRRERATFKSAGIVITSDTELFFGTMPKNCYAVTGSSGKSTVTSLVSLLLGERFKRIFTGGNIGTPIATAELCSSEAYVIELSSFNLMYSLPNTCCAAVTNISENHLDWHKDYREYIDAKMRIYEKTQRPVLNADDRILSEMTAGREFFAVFSVLDGFCTLKRKHKAEHYVTLEGSELMLDGRSVIPRSEIRLRGIYNVQNLMTAAAMTAECVSTAWIGNVARSFSGLEHRCEVFLEFDGMTFIDSSIDTTPSRTAATLRALGKRVRIILGGTGKMLSADVLLSALDEYAEMIALYGDEGYRLCALIDESPRLKEIPHCRYDSFEDAVQYITSGLGPGSTVLLSPAATAYGEFRSFEVRGDRFKDHIYRKYNKTKKMCN